MMFRPPRFVRDRISQAVRVRLGSSAAPVRTILPKMSRRSMVTASAVVIVVIAGCDEQPDMRDQRLAQFAQDVMKTQKQQNDRIAAQSQAVVKQSQHVTEAARDLVRHDAEARREMVLVHADLVGRLDRQREAVDEARDRLEQERIEIAERRNRDPVIARAVESVGRSLLCLVPVVVSLFVVRQMTAGHIDDAVVAELLTVELSRTAPKLLALTSSKPVAAIEDGSGRRSPSGYSGHGPEPFAPDQAGATESGHRCSQNVPDEDPDDDPDAWMGRIDFPEDDDFPDEEIGPGTYPDRFRRE